MMANMYKILQVGGETGNCILAQSFKGVRGNVFQTRCINSMAGGVI